MAGERRLHRLGGGLGVADLAHHDDVRVLTQDVLERVREAGARPGIGGDLVEVLVHHLDGVLDGDHVHLGRGEGLQRGVEGGGLPAAGRTGHHHQPVRPEEPALERLALVRQEPQLGEVADQDVRVEDPHHHLVAEGGGNRRHAQLHLRVAARGADAAVLRPLQGDVEPAHDLEPIGDGPVHGPGDPVDGVEHAVDPHPDDGLLPARLDVDVAGALLEGVVEQVLDRGDHRLGGGLQRLDPGEVHELLEIPHVRRGRVLELDPGLRDLLAEAVDLGDGAVDVGGRGQDRLHVSARQAPQVLDQLPVERVGGRDEQHPVAALQREHAVLAREGPGQRPGDELGVELERVDLAVRDLQRLGQGLGDLVLVDHLALAAGVHELEGGQDLHRGDLGTAQPAPACARGGVPRPAAPAARSRGRRRSGVRRR